MLIMLAFVDKKKKYSVGRSREPEHPVGVGAPFRSRTKSPFRHRMTFVYLSSSIIIRLSLPRCRPLRRFNLICIALC